MPPRFRFDSPDHRTARQKAVQQVLAAVQLQFPVALKNLRDLKRHPHEGWTLMEAGLFERVSRALESSLIGRLYKLAELDIPANAETETGQRDPLRQYVTIGDDLGSFQFPVVVMFVPRPVCRWAEKWRLSAPWIEITAVLLRSQWRRQPAAARKCQLMFSSLPTVLHGRSVRLPSEEQWRAMGVPSVGPNPMVESESEFKSRAAAEYRKRLARYYAAPGQSEADTGAVGTPRFQRKKQPRELPQHAEWLVRVQIGGESLSDIARVAHQSVPAVHRAVHQLAKFIGLPLRALPKTGRPKGRRDASPGRRPSRKF